MFRVAGVSWVVRYEHASEVLGKLLVLGAGEAGTDGSCYNGMCMQRTAVFLGQVLAEEEAYRVVEVFGGGVQGRRQDPVGLNQHASGDWVRRGKGK
ncbi:hypothetical protein BGK72_00400 [Streptomyces agglomeratus]|nr:hypothetical protein BGK72_00400 [Streptomyces agglomeratus]